MNGIDLSTFASKANEINIGGDDIVELGDDLGVSLFSNPNKVAASPRPASRPQVSFGGGDSGGGGMPQISIKGDDDFGVVDLDAAPGASNIQINREPEPMPFTINTGDGMGGGNGQLVSKGTGMSPEEEARQKQGYLTKLQRLENGGIKGMRMSMSNTLEDIKTEYEKLTDSKNLEASIRFQRSALITFINGVEMATDKFGHRLPVKPRLKGWAEAVHTNIEDYDEIFEELYDLYKDKAKTHPFVRLVMMLGVSGAMYHITKTMAEQSGIPGMGELMRDNPDLQRQFAKAAAARMGGLGNFVNAAAEMGGPPGPDPMGGAFNHPPPSPPRTGMSGRGPFNGASNVGEPVVEAPRARREMRGPTGVDDILKAFETERLIQQSNVPISPANVGVFTPSGPPPTPPRGVSILRENVGTNFDPMAEFLNGAGDDAGSIGSGSTMNTERRRGRKRAVATPVGTTLNLNV
jgi:hypothetical protein